MSQQRRLLIVLSLAIITRILFALIATAVSGPLAFYREDSNSYVRPAESLLHGVFMSSGVNSLPGTPELYRTPGYPVILLPAVALHHVVIIALLENFLLVIASALLVRAIVNDLGFGSRAAFWAVVLYCFEPLGFLSSEMIMSETAFTAALLLFVWLFLKFFRQPTYFNLIMAALALSCATYIRPVSLYLAVWLIPVFFLFRTDVPLRERASQAIVFPILCALTLAPWVVRNAVVADYPKFTTSQDYNLYFMAAGAVQSRLEPHVFSQSRLEHAGDHTPFEWYLIDHPEQRNWTTAQIARFWNQEAKKIILPHWSTYAYLHTRASVGLLLNPGITDALLAFHAWPRTGMVLYSKINQGFIPAVTWLFRESRAAVILFPLLSVVTLLYYVLGLAGLRHIPRQARFLFCALVVYIVAISSFPTAAARYRVPFLPLFCISAAIAVDHWLRSKKIPSQAFAAQGLL